MQDFAKYFPSSIRVGQPLSLSDCRVLRPYLLERAGIIADNDSGVTGSVIMLAVPYAVPCAHRTVSMYAVAKDYHAYFDALFASVLPALRADFPSHVFAGFADHSPIAEVEAACMAGLGIMGSNGLLLTPEHGSYVFLGEIVTTLPTDSTPQPVLHCPDCGACRRACPVSLDRGSCLSALTQKKGALDGQQLQRLREHNLIWGCDTCQEVCPINKAAARAGTLYTKVPYFSEDLIPAPDLALLQSMPDADFARRAYAWRGRETICRNLKIKEEEQI